LIGCRGTSSLSLAVTSLNNALSSLNDGEFVSTDKKKRAAQVSYKDVMIAYLADGVDAVDRLLTQTPTASAAIRKALKALRDQGVAAATLEALIKARISDGKRGRQSPIVGDERTYRAQQLAKAGAFINLPVTPLGIAKRGLVVVRFEQDRIVVSKP